MRFKDDENTYITDAAVFVHNSKPYVFSLIKYPDCKIDYSADFEALLNTISFDAIATGSIEPNESYDSSEANDGFGEELSEYESGKYLYITNEDLDSYGKNMVGEDIYIVGIVDDLKDHVIQITLNDGFMMSNFDVGDRFDHYRELINKGDTIAILGTVSGYNDYSFMGHTIEVTGCQVFAMGEDVSHYQKENSDERLQAFFVEPKEASVFTVQTPIIYEGHGTVVTINDVVDNGSSIDMKINIKNDSDLNLGFNARAYGVNGIMTGNNIYDMDCDVAAHREANTTLALKKTFLEKYNIGVIKKIDLLLWAYDNDKNFKEFDSGQITIYTNEDDGNYEEVIIGETVYNNNGLRIDYLGNEKEGFKFAAINDSGTYLDFDFENLRKH